MLRGAEKRMIVVRTRDSRMFEEAYFVVRPEADRGGRGEPDMLWEANRILESSMAGWRDETAGTSSATPLRKRIMGRAIWFLTGLLAGGSTVGLLWLLL